MPDDLPHLKPMERALLRRIAEATDGALILHVIFAESRAAIRRLEWLEFLGLIERCAHPTIRASNDFFAPACRATDVGRATLAQPTKKAH